MNIYDYGHWEEGRVFVFTPPFVNEQGWEIKRIDLQHIEKPEDISDDDVIHAILTGIPVERNGDES